MQQNNSRRENDDFSFEIIRHYGVLSSSGKGWRRELNFVKWNDREPKFDLRDWQPDHEKMSKGITLNNSEMLELIKIVKGISVGQEENQPAEVQGSAEPEVRLQQAPA